LLQQLSYVNPDLALQMLEESPGFVDYAIRNQLAQRLMADGRKDAADRLLDQALSDFSTRQNDFKAVAEFQGHLGFLSRTDPDRFLSALPVWLEASRKAQPPPAVNIVVGDREIALSGTEAMSLSLLRGLQFSRSGLFTKALNMLPELKSKADSAGGVDALLGSRIVAGMPAGGAVGRQTGGGVSANTVSRGTIGRSGGENSLYQDLRARQARDPDGLRNTLGQLARDPDKVRSVLDFAARALYEDPEAASSALEIAQPAVLKIEPLSRRAEMYQYLVRSWRQCDGEVDSGLLKEGFIIADDLREETRRAETETEPPGGPRWSPADSLEAMVLAELSRTSFDLAMRHVRTLPDGQLKFNALFQIVQAVSQP
jgi:hypothetical protein